MDTILLNQEKLFTRYRTTLYSICTIIFLLHVDLSVLLDSIFQKGFTQRQQDSLTAILLILLLISGVRYHQSVLLSEAWKKMSTQFVPYKRSMLWRNGIILDITSEGESEHSEDDWYHMSEDSKDYIFTEETYYKTTDIKKWGEKGPLTGIRRLRMWWIIAYLKVRALAKFSINHPAVLDVAAPYIFFILAFLEITGLVKISQYVTELGSYFSNF